MPSWQARPVALAILTSAAVVLHVAGGTELPLAADDECLAGVDEGACAIEAMQRRGLARLAQGAAPVPERPAVKEAEETGAPLGAAEPNATDSPNGTVSAKGFCTPTHYLANCWQSRFCCDVGMGCYEKVPGLAYCMASCTPGYHPADYPVLPWTCTRLDVKEQRPVPGTCHAESCGRNVATCYALNWKAEGKTFFDDFVFVTHDSTHGMAKYVNKTEAFAEGVVSTTDTHARIGLGPRVDDYKVLSANVHSKYTWDPMKSFLVAVKLSDSPSGCGVWPAFWVLNSEKTWPEGAELDIFEWSDDFPAASTLHTGKTHPCFLDAHEANKCFRQVDGNHHWECTTDYFPPTGPKKVGCSVNTPERQVGEYYHTHPGVVAMEWTSTYIKVFHIAESEIPEDLLNDKPRPATWDRFITAYYPFDEKACPNRNVTMRPQEIVFNIQVCGDWAGGAWEKPGQFCPLKTGFWSVLGRCKVDVWDPSKDCCTQWIMSPGADQTLKNAAFDISWLKVFTDPSAPAPSPATESSTYRRGGFEQCSREYTNCKDTRCCADRSMRCYAKNAEWAGCRKSCTPGVYEEDPVEVRTPWNCTELTNGVA
uniref:GH16 domain-containing protein n=1 Tax=Alexandrium monilatum TaxID=311494 RepID=A0A7S4SGA6_9DINO